MPADLTAEFDSVRAAAKAPSADLTAEFDSARAGTATAATAPRAAPSRGLVLGPTYQPLPPSPLKMPPVVVRAPSSAMVPSGTPLGPPVRGGPIAAPSPLAPKPPPELTDRLAMRLGAMGLGAPEQPGRSPLAQDLYAQRQPGAAERAATALGEMIGPAGTNLPRMLAMPLGAGQTLAQYLATRALAGDRNVRAAIAQLEQAPESGVPQRGEALSAAFQLGGAALAGPVAREVTGALAPAAMEGAALTPGQVLRGVAARTAGRMAGGVVAGTPWAPQDPAVGAILGAGIPLVESAIHPLGTVRRLPPPEAPGIIPEQIGTGGARPFERAPFFTQAERAPTTYPAEPDYTVEPLGEEPPPAPPRAPPRAPTPAPPAGGVPKDLVADFEGQAPEAAPTAAPTKAPRGAQPLAPELEAIAQHHIKVFTPGMDDRTDQMTSQAAINRLPPDDKKAVQQRLKFLTRQPPPEAPRPAAVPTAAPAPVAPSAKAPEAAAAPVEEELGAPEHQRWMDAAYRTDPEVFRHNFYDLVPQGETLQKLREERDFLHGAVDLPSQQALENINYMLRKRDVAPSKMTSDELASEFDVLDAKGDNVTPAQERRRDAIDDEIRRRGKQAIAGKPTPPPSAKLESREDLHPTVTQRGKEGLAPASVEFSDVSTSEKPVEQRAPRELTRQEQRRLAGLREGRQTRPRTQEQTKEVFEGKNTGPFMDAYEKAENAFHAGDKETYRKHRTEWRRHMVNMSPAERTAVTDWWYAQASDDLEDAVGEGRAAEDNAKANRSRAQQARTLAQKLNEQEGVKAPAERAAPPKAPAPEPATPVRDARGRLQKNLKKVSAAELQAERDRLTEANAEEEGRYLAVESQGYRASYHELPRTEKLGHKGKEDLPDADATRDPEQLLADNQIAAEYNRRQVQRANREKAIARIDAELDRRHAPLRQMETPALLDHAAELERRIAAIPESNAAETEQQRQYHEASVEHNAVMKALRDRMDEETLDEELGKRAEAHPEPTEPDEFMSFMKTGEGKVGAGFDKSLFKKLGANLYQGDIASVAVKEGIQNAIDALRALPKADQARGSIHVVLDAPNRTIIVQDNGVGMAPEVAANQFMDVGGSLKPDEASGGFGLAKVGLLASAEHFTMTTVAQTGHGKATRTTIHGSGEDWANGNLHYETNPAPYGTLHGEPSGTTLSIKFEETAPLDWGKAATFIRNASHYGRLPYQLTATDVSKYGGATTALTPIPDEMKRGWYPFHDMKPEPLTSIEVPGAKADVYESKATGPTYGLGELHVLNNGLYQFTEPINVGEQGPKALVVDVKPTAGIESPDYPFTTNREQLKGPVSKRIKDLGLEMKTIGAKREIETLVKTLNEGAKIPRSPHKVLDTTGGMPHELLDRIAQRPYAKRLSDLSERVMQAIIEHTPGARTKGEKAIFGGLSTSKEYLGVNIHGEALRLAAEKSGAAGGALSKGNLILYNPWTTFNEMPGGLPTDDYEAQWMTNQWWGTMVHEVAHELARGHDERFAGELTRMMGRLGRIQGPWLDAADELFYDMVQPQSVFRRDFDDVRTEWLKDRPDLFKKFSDAEEASEGTRDLDRRAARGDEPLAGASASRGRGLPSGRNAGQGALRGRAGAGGQVGGGGAGAGRAPQGQGPAAGGPAAAGGGGGGVAGGGGNAGGVPPGNGPVGSAAGGAIPLPDAPGLDSEYRAKFRPLDVIRRVQELLNPESLGAAAKGVAGTIGHETARSWRDLAIANEALKTFSRYVGRLPKADAVELWDKAEHGRATGDPAVDRMVDLLHQITKQYTDQLVALDRLKAESTIEHYIGRFWTGPKNAPKNWLRTLLGRRPFEGPKSFLKARSLVNFTDGLKAGLVPQTYNFVDAQLAKIAEMQRVIAAQKILQQEKAAGRAQKVRFGKPAPRDAQGREWARIGDGTDPAFQVLSRDESGGLVKHGDWYAHPDAIPVWQNHLSRGYAGSPLYDAFMAPGQAAQQLLLAFSGFHGTVISTEAAFSDLANAAQEVINRGRLASAGTAAARAPIAPIVNYRLGKRIMREYRRPGTHPELAKTLDAMIAGGYRGTAESEFWSGDRIKKFKKALWDAQNASTQTKRALAAARVPLTGLWAAVEASTLPILGRYVPYMKAAALYTATSNKLAELAAHTNGPVELPVLRKEMRDLSREMDYRFGQVNYDNLFVDRALKNVGQALLLAPGWTVGTLALAGRGVRDIGALPVRAARRFRDRGKAPPNEPPPDLLGKSAAYWIAAVLGTMLINGILTYAHTGQKPTWKDFFAYRDGTTDDEGNPTRHTIPGYLMHDIYPWTHHPITTALSKQSPTLQFGERFVQNKGARPGTMMYDQRAPFFTQAYQVAKDAARQALPITASSTMEARRRGESLGSSLAQNILGVAPARRELTRTPAQNLEYSFLAGHGGGEMTPEQAAASATRRDITKQLRTGTTGVGALADALARKQITTRQASSIISNALKDPRIATFDRLTAEQAVAVYNAGSSAEQTLYRVPTQLKVARAIAGGADAASLQMIDKPRPKAKVAAPR
jgi:hypothetical protein